jgi:putative flavoprotein involved in K+ transport
MGRSVIVVGGGPAGLAVAASARRRGLHVTVIDRAGRVGASWADRYDRLHLHTPRVQSHLPGYRLPRHYSRFVARDDLVRYLEEYARVHGIDPDLGVEVVRVDRAPGGDGWRVTTTAGHRHAGRVVLATGYNNVPHVPDWPGRRSFPGRVMHAADYRDPSPFAGQRVLVVGTGNTGAEIAADLAAAGATSVHLSIRTAPHVIPRAILGLPTTLIGVLNEHLPPALTDPVSRVLVRLTVGDLRRHGMPVPAAGLVAHFRRTDTVPVIDVGLVEQLRAGRVVPAPEVVGFDGGEVLLGDGGAWDAGRRGRKRGPRGRQPAAGAHHSDSNAGRAWSAGRHVGGTEPPRRLAVDAVIAATGYRTGLEPLVGHLGVLDGHGRPTVTGARSHPDAPGLYFVGWRNPLSGVLLAIRTDARRVARVLAAPDRARRDRAGRALVP